MNDKQYSVSELALAVNEWCKTHQVQPLHNRVGLEVTVRNIRYYQTLGLVDRPTGSHGHGFTEKHRLQLIAIRLLQAKGLPLEKIHALLYSRSEEELAEIEQRGLAELERMPRAGQVPLSSDWTVIPMSEELLLLSRSRREITPAQRQRILEILEGSPAELPTEPVPAFEEETFRPEID